MVTAIVIIVLVALLLLGLLAFQRARKKAELQQRRSELKDRFGPEYERYLSGSDNRDKAERKLVDLVDRRDKIEIKDLTEEQKAQYEARWSAAQARFVDEPPAAVDDAETLITQVMKERGYPMDDFHTRADMIMVDHPEIVQHYRSAHESHERHRASGQLETEDLRVAFTHYRKLFHALMGTEEPDTTTTRPVHGGKHVDPDAPVVDVRDGDEGRTADGRPPVTGTRSTPGTGEVVDADGTTRPAGTTGPRHPQEMR
jgi:hypothetical protein